MTRRVSRSLQQVLLNLALYVTALFSKDLVWLRIQDLDHLLCPCRPSISTATGRGLVGGAAQQTSHTTSVSCPPLTCELSRPWQCDGLLIGETASMIRSRLAGI